METVQCYCTQCKVEDTRQEMGEENYGRFTVLFEMFQRLNWLYKGKSLGCGIKYVYSNENYKLYSYVKNSEYQKLTAEVHRTGVGYPYDEFMAKVADNTNTTMKLLNKLRNEYLELQKVFNTAKYYNSTYDTTELELPFTASYGFDSDKETDTQLVCARCGNEEITILSPKWHLDHLGVTSADVNAEFDMDDKCVSNGLYSDDDYDYSTDEILNKEIKREYADHALYNATVEYHKAEAEFYDMAHCMTMGQVRRKLGRVKSDMLNDIISEYYSAKM